MPRYSNNRDYRDDSNDPPWYVQQIIMGLIIAAIIGAVFGVKWLIEHVF